MTPEERALDCKPRQAYTDEIDLECVARIAQAIREAAAEEREACATIAQKTWEEDYGYTRGIVNVADLIRGQP